MAAAGCRLGLTAATPGARPRRGLAAATVGCTAISGVLLVWIVRRLEAGADARAAALIEAARRAAAPGAGW